MIEINIGEEYANAEEAAQGLEYIASQLREGYTSGYSFTWSMSGSEEFRFDTALDAAQANGYEEVVDLEQHGSVDLLEVRDLEEKQALEWLEERTTVRHEDGRIVIKKF